MADAARLKVLHLILGLQVGGLETMVVRLVQALDRRRYQPMVCCIDELGPLAGELERSGIEVQLLRRKPGTDWGYPRRLAAMIKRSGVDVLHLHNPTALFYGAPAGRLAGIRPIIYTEHGRDYSTGWKSLMAHRLLGRMVHQVVVLHERARSYMQQQEWVPARRITKIHNGIEAPPPPAPDTRARLRQELGIPADAAVITIVARLDPIKNLPGLLTAMRRVTAELPRSQLLVVGDGPLRESLENQAQDQQLADVVHFLGTRHDVPDLLAASDLLVLPSFSEGLSMTLIEGCAAGLPLVASDVGGSNELVDPPHNGLLVPPDDPAALAGALVSVLERPETARAMGHASKQRFARLFEAPLMVAGYQRLYDLSRRDDRTAGEPLQLSR